MCVCVCVCVCVVCVCVCVLSDWPNFSKVKTSNMRQKYAGSFMFSHVSLWIFCFKGNDQKREDIFKIKP